MAELVGMAPLKAHLAELKAKVEYVQGGGDPRLLEGCLNVVLTGNPGAGKTTAARLLFRSLRSFGCAPLRARDPYCGTRTIPSAARVAVRSSPTAAAPPLPSASLPRPRPPRRSLLKKNVFVERNALELKGTHIGWTCPQVKEMVQAALGGCLFLDEAYALSGGGKDGDRGDSFSDEALRTLLTETENNRNGLCVVLAGYRDGMAHLMRADPGLVRRFPTALHLGDYTPSELAAIARQTATARYGLSFAPGLEAALAEHICAVHAAEIAKHNASLAVQLVEAAANRLAARLVAAQTGASTPAADAEAAADSMRVLEPSDFAIEPSGASAAVRARVEAEVARLPPELEVARVFLEAIHHRLRFMLEGAAGGMLVLHDAGMLTASPAATRALATALVQVPATTAVVLEGLPDEMAALFASAAPLAACFPPLLHLPDLSAAQVARLVTRRAAGDFQLCVPADVEVALAAHLAAPPDELVSHRNGVLAELLLQAAVGRLASRVAAAAGRGGSGRTSPTPKAATLTAEDFGLGSAADASPVTDIAPD